MESPEYRDRHRLRMTRYGMHPDKPRWELTAEHDGEVIAKGQFPIPWDDLQEVMAAWHRKVDAAC